MIEAEFVQITEENIEEYLLRINALFSSYRKFFLDDYAANESGTGFIKNFILQNRLNFWVIKGNGEFAGFVFLDEFVGREEILHSAELTVCFEKKFWGKFPRIAAEKFFRYCFKELGLVKIKAGIYPENNRVRSLLKDCGFKSEGILRAETLRNGRLQDIETFGLINPLI